MTDENKTGRFLLFRGDRYYASGGWHDFTGDYSTLEEALAVGPRDKVGEGVWRHVVDIVSRQIVFAEPEGWRRRNQEYRGSEVKDDDGPDSGTEDG